MMTKEKEEELAVLVGMDNRKNNLLLPHNYSESIPPPRKARADEFWNSENDKSDHDGLIPLETSLFPSLEKDSKKTVLSQIEIPNTLPTAQKSRLTKIPAEAASRSIMPPKQPNLPSGQNSSGDNNEKPSLSGGLTAPRPETPTGRPTLPSATKPSGSSTPTLQVTFGSTKNVAPKVRNTTSSISTSRSLTPTFRPSLPALKSTSRSATPNRGPLTPSVAPSLSAPPGRSTSAPKSAPTNSRNLLSRGSSLKTKSRSCKPSEKAGFSAEAPPNLRKSFPQRPASASKDKLEAPSARSSSINSVSSGKTRKQSCSYSIGRASHGSAYSNGITTQENSRSRRNDSEIDSPVLVGTKMVERLVNMRKLAPPQQDDSRFTHNNQGSKSLFSDSSGFGRTLSKKSLDMALRHMDIGRSIQFDLCPVAPNIPASSICSVRSRPVKMTVSAVDSPLACSSNASSEPLAKNPSFCLDESEIEDDHELSKRGNSSHGK
ncbi:hypothetical protein I3760_09G207900 [Carya illinoinensis]|nr:hypothetical protein I3760_09G207900 [Carya illinoinensis]